MKSVHSSARTRPPRDPWTGRFGMTGLSWSLLLHVWWIGMAMALVWKIWEGPQDQPATKTILPPGGGGAGKPTLLVTRYQLKEQRRPVKGGERRLMARMPGPVVVASPAPERLPQRSVHAMAQAHLPGEGGGPGLGPSSGQGAGSGMSAGYSASGVYSSRRPGPDNTPAKGQSVTLVVDTSRSTGQGEGRAMALFVSQLEALDPAVHFNVVCFASRAWLFSPGGVPANPENRAAATAFVRDLAADPAGTGHEGQRLPVPDNTSGTSRLDLGLAAALGQDADDVVLITDGRPLVRHGMHQLNHDEILTGLRNLPAGNRPRIHLVATRVASSGLLPRIAAASDRPEPVAADGPTRP